MIKTILFDLDGTLIQMTQKEFIGAYFKELAKVFVRMNMDPKASADAVWAGTMAMVQNDGTMLNRDRFWAAFQQALNLSEDALQAAEAACDNFYINEFHAVKAVVQPSEIPRRLISALKDKGYSLVLATNPLFPLCAVESRLSWAGLTPSDFIHITHYGNSGFCKPNPAYYKEIFSKIGADPAHCIMIGNNPAEDMVAGTLGTQTFLVTDYIENEPGLDISQFRQGSLAELEAFLSKM